MNIKTALIAVAVSSCMLTSTLGQASEHSSVFTPEQEKRIGEIAADYMRAHPDILIQMSEKL
ncbi:DsbA family protein, partial [Klebsiella pneumoniae]